MNLSLRCLFKGHKMRAVRAEDREPDGYIRYDKETDEKYPIPSCYIVEECRNCDRERRIYSTVELAEFEGVPLEWEEDD